jgi:fructokinase
MGADSTGPLHNRESQLSHLKFRHDAWLTLGSLNISYHLPSGAVTSNPKRVDKPERIFITLRERSHHSRLSGVYCAGFDCCVSEGAQNRNKSREGPLVNVVSIGEVLWDVVGQQEHLGGATFNFSAHLSKLGHSVSFISAVGADQRGRKILENMQQLGLSTRYVRVDSQHATGSVTVTLDAAGQPSFVLHRPAAYDFPQLTESQSETLISQPTEWIYFGTLHQMSPDAKALTATLLERIPDARRFYDVNLRMDSYTSSLVRELMARATVVKLNDTEVMQICQMFGRPCDSLEEFCRSYAKTFGWEAVCVTRGANGCVLFIGDQYCEANGYRIDVADAVGAGDAFAAAFVHGLGNGWPAPQIVDFANRVGALVASRTGAIPTWTVEEAKALKTKTCRLESA